MSRKYLLTKAARRWAAALLLLALAGYVFARPGRMISRRQVLRLAIPNDQVANHMRARLESSAGWNTDVEVEVTSLPYDALYNAVKDQSFDVVMVDDPWLASLVECRRLRTVPKHLDGLRPQFAREFLRVAYYGPAMDGDRRPPMSVMESCFPNGACNPLKGYELYGLPYVGNAQMLVWDPARIRVEGKFPTWRELFDGLRPTRDARKQVAAFSSRLSTNNGAVVDFLPILWAYGGCILGEGGQVGFAKRGTLGYAAAVSALQKSIDAAAFSPVQYSRFRDEDVFEYLHSGLVATGISWLAYANRLPRSDSFDGSRARASEATYRPKFGPMPPMIDTVQNAQTPCALQDTRTGALGTWLLAVDSGSRNPELAWSFIEWALDVDGEVPDRASPFTHQLRDLDKEIIARSRPRQSHPYWRDIEDALGIRIRQAHWRTLSVEAALDEAARDLESILQRKDNEHCSVQ